MKQEIVMNHFVSAIVMGEEIFKGYLDKAESRELKKIIRDFLSSFETQKNDLKISMQRYGMNPDEDCSILQKNAIVMEKIKTKTMKDDYDLCLNIIHSMNDATVGALKYFRKCDPRIRNAFRRSVENLMSNYDNIIGKIKSFSIHSI